MGQSDTYADKLLIVKKSKITIKINIDQWNPKKKNDEISVNKCTLKFRNNTALCIN